jgi:hypothetical protein
MVTASFPRQRAQYGALRAVIFNPLDTAVFQGELVDSLGDTLLVASAYRDGAVPTHHGRMLGRLGPCDHFAGYSYSTAKSPGDSLPRPLKVPATNMSNTLIVVADP